MATHSICVATDFSPDAERAIGRGTHLAQGLGASLEFLHVVPAGLLESWVALFSNARGASSALVDAAQAELDRLAAGPSSVGVRCTTRVETGTILGDLLAAAQRADLLIVGAHGTNPLRDAILGTTAERLLRKCTRSILVAKREATGPYRQVLVPVDFSAYSAPSLRSAIELAPQAEIVVVHACDVPFESKLRAAGVDANHMAEYRAAATSDATRRIAELVASVSPLPERVRYLVEPGSPARVVLTQAQVLGADLIVIGKHGQSALEELFLGSVTRHVLSASDCDVLVAHEGGVTAVAQG